MKITQSFAPSSGGARNTKSLAAQQKNALKKLNESIDTAENRHFNSPTTRQPKLAAGLWGRKHNTAPEHKT